MMKGLAEVWIITHVNATEYFEPFAVEGFQSIVIIIHRSMCLCCLSVLHTMKKMLHGIMQTVN